MARKVAQIGRQLNQPEHQLQKAVVQHAQMRARLDPLWGLLFAVPNGGARDAVTGAILKAEGVRRGVPDLCLPVSRPGYPGGLFIEMKVPGNRPSKDQKWWHRALISAGHVVEVCYSAGEAIKIIEAYLKPASQEDSQFLERARAELRALGSQDEI